MSVFAVEQVLYDISVKREARARFREDMAALLRSYPLSDEERRLIATFDVGELYRRGVSPLLTMGFWMTTAAERSMDAYLRSMRR